MMDMNDKKDMMDMENAAAPEINDQELEQAAGGSGIHHYSTSSRWKTVSGLKSGYLAMRTGKCYDYANEKRGCELYNGDKVKIIEKATTGKDGRKYALVYSPKHNTQGYVNAAYLK